MPDRNVNPERFPLSDEHLMLLRIRDTIYEGHWGDFTHDLTARVEGKPHVFETVPANPHMKATIERHLRLIEQMGAWETKAGTSLQADS